MARFTTAAVLTAALLAASAARAHDASQMVASSRKSFNFNTDWRTKVGDPKGAAQIGFDDAGWDAATLPHAFNEREAFKRGIRDLSTGVVWYRKHFRVPVTAGQKVFLEFEGVRQAAEVWVNGTRIGLSENGVMAFGADITAALRPGDNLIAVRVDSDWYYKERATGSGFQWQDRNFNANYGGINKNVRLHVTDGIYQTLPLWAGLGTTGQYIWADRFDLPTRTATINAETQVRNDSGRARTVRYSVEIRDRAGKRVGTFTGAPTSIKPGETRTLTGAQRLSGLNFWSWGYGYLYTVTTSLIEDGRAIDSVDTVTGFRQTRFNKGMVELNGRTIQMHGYALRTTNEWPAVGISVPPWLSDYSNAMMVEGGGNLNRWMHITPSKQDVESHDRVGIMQAMPAGDSEKDTRGRHWAQRVEVMRDAIIYNRNNPSIVFYEAGNEDITEAHMAEMKAVRDRYDPHGGRAIGSREMLDSKVAEYGGEMLYINKSAGIPMWAMEYARTEAPRGYQDELTPPFHQDSPDYNRNQDSFAVEQVKQWWDYYRIRPGTGDRVSSGGVKIMFADSNTFFRGDNNYRRSGDVDAVRLPKDAFFAHKVMWSDWVDSTTPGTALMGHWNYRPGNRRPVHAVSTGDRVELFLNGRSLGMGTRLYGFLFTWPDVAWEAGSLRAVASHAGGQTTTATVETAGAPVALRLKSHVGPRGFVMDGADIALVDVEVVDARGRRVPTANDKVSFALEGPAEWRGGIAQGDSSGRPRAAVATMDEKVEGVTPETGTARGEDNYVGARTLPVELGINRVLLRAGTRPGVVRLRASAPGLTDASIELATVLPKASAAGLSEDFPEHAQRGLLTRGPTPVAPTYRVTKRTFRPERITAAANQADLGKVIDDNEMSRWAADGRKENAWVEFSFARPELFDALDLKLVGWRTRAYPLEVFVDGKLVWKGTTAKTLGYYGIDFPATRGRVIRIVQTGPTADLDGFGNIVEVDTARKAGDTGADQVPVGWSLALVEADFHGPVARR